MVDVQAIYTKISKIYRKAYKSLEEKIPFNESVAISDVIPGFKADDLLFGSYEESKFGILFVDMRDSSKRALSVGGKITFLTMHIYLSSLIEVAIQHGGKVIDIMGDGLMVFWNVDDSNVVSKDIKTFNKAVECGLDMLLVTDEVINRLIKDEKLGNGIKIGVGVDIGDVVVTKIGIDQAFDTKAFGDCINMASKYANSSSGVVKISGEGKVLLAPFTEFFNEVSNNEDGTYSIALKNKV